VLTKRGNNLGHIRTAYDGGWVVKLDSGSCFLFRRVLILFSAMKYMFLTLLSFV
jgi:hypothetical protein